MKKVITAVGNEELNNILKRQESIIIENPDIQYQEGIIEALDKYNDIEMVILKDDIIGELEIEDLIRSIIIMKNDIEIILITEEEAILAQCKNIVKLVNDKYNYVNIVLKYLVGEIYIKQENATFNVEEEYKISVAEEEKLPNKVKIQKKKYQLDWIKEVQEKCKSIFNKREKESNIITVIGNSGVR